MIRKTPIFAIFFGGNIFKIITSFPASHNNSPAPTWSHPNIVMAPRESQHRDPDPKTTEALSDIFSQALASAEIEGFTSESGE
jgi:predicted lipid-binding transport protein (Tim44 family)